MKAKFIGKRSCGFTTNTVYDVQFKTNKKGQIELRSKEGFCIYSSIKAMLANWQFLDVDTIKMW